MNYVTVTDVEIAAVGMKWPASTGPVTLTLEHLADAVTAAMDDPHVLLPRIKVGHTDPRFNEAEPIYDPFAYHGSLREDGNPAFGRVANLRLANDGGVILGDLIDVPEWLADAMPSAYPTRSLEGDWDIETPGGKRYSFVLTALALGGEWLPAIQNLEDLQRLLTDGPAAVPASASKEEPMPVSAAASTDAVMRAFWNEFCQGDRYWWWPVDIRVDPNEVIADDDEGHLYRVPFKTDGDGNVTFKEPVRVVQEFRDVPEPAAASKILARFPSAVAARRAAGGIRAASETVTDKDWDGSAARFTDAEYARSCVLDRLPCGDEWRDKPVKQRYSLPVREPDGTLNRNGVHSAAGRVGQVTACDEAKTKAAKKLVSLYRNQLEEDPPQGLLDLAGASASRDPRPARAGQATEGGTMPVPASILERLGLPEDATEEQWLAKLDELGEQSPDGGNDDGGNEGAGVEQRTPEAVAASDRVTTIDKARLEQLERDAEMGRVARLAQVKGEAERLVDAAKRDGRIAPASAASWLSAIYDDKRGELVQTEVAALASLAKGRIPVDEIGGAPAEQQEEQATHASLMRDAYGLDVTAGRGASNG